MPPSLVVVAWAALGSTAVAREFLGKGPRGMRGIKPGIPVAVLGAESDGEVRHKVVQDDFKIAKKSPWGLTAGGRRIEMNAHSKY